MGKHRSMDSLPEWSKGVDSSSTGANLVGSNPTAVTFAQAEQSQGHALDHAIRQQSWGLSGVCRGRFEVSLQQGSGRRMHGLLMLYLFCVVPILSDVPRRDSTQTG